MACLDRFFGIEDSDFIRVSCYAVLAIIVTAISVIGHRLMVKSRSS